MTERTEPNGWRPGVVIEPYADESIAGLVMRFCDENGWPDLQSFLDRLELPAKASQVSRGAARLVDAMRSSMPDIQALLRRQATTSISTFGETIPLRYLAPTKRRICRSCLNSLGYQKFWWDFEFLSACPQHHELIVDRCNCGQLLSWHDAALSYCRYCDGNWQGPVEPQVDRVPDDFEMWCFGRLKITEPPSPVPILDALPFPFALDLVDGIGTLFTRGYERLAPLPEHLSLSKAEVRLQGFNLLHDGKLDELFSEVAAGHRKATGQSFPRAPLDALGWFGDWFAGLLLDKNHPAVHAVLSALESALGYPIVDLSNSRVTSLETLARDLRISTDKVLSILNEMGHKPGGHHGTLVGTPIASLVIKKLRKPYSRPVSALGGPLARRPGRPPERQRHYHRSGDDHG